MSSSDNSADCCESCSTNFTLFKRKKICNFCKQAFCQFCVNRHNYSTPLSNRNQSSSSNSSSSSSSSTSFSSSMSNLQSSDRICNICSKIFDPHTTTEEILKLKLKHLRAFLACANVATSTCKDKQDLAELVMKSRTKYNLRTSNNNNNNNNNSSNNRSQSQNSNNSNQNSNNSNNNSSSFNDKFNGFMHNVQDFVNFNLNSVLNNPVPAPAPQTSSTTRIPRSNTNNGSNNTNNPPSSSSSTSSSSYSSSNSFIPPNVNSVFNFIGEQIPNVLSQTINSFASSTSNNDNNRQQQQSTSTNTSSSERRNSQQQQQRRNTTPPAEPEPATQTSSGSSNSQPTNLKRRASLSDLKSESDIENLNVKQIKEILANNFVEYKGCCEKKELLEKLKRLYNSHLENKRIEQELNNNCSTSNNYTNVNEGSSSGSKKADESDICKICMESIIDCVLLDCGHMCSCIKCGKQLAECPICRQNVVRVIRVFKS